VNTQTFEQLPEFIIHAYHNTKTVKSIFDRAGIQPSDIQSVADLDRIPVTSKDRLVELQAQDPPFGGLLTVPLEQLQHIYLSPGPLYEPDAGESASLDSVKEMATIAGFGEQDVILNAFGYHYIPTGLALDTSLINAGATVIPAGVGNAELQIKMMLDHRVTGYTGTPSWLMALITKAEESGLNFTEQFSLSKALVSAEPLPPSLRAKFVDEYQIQLTNAYGTAELGFLAYSTEPGLAMHLLETSIIQVVNPETGLSVNPGEVGEVAVTTFNKIYPLIRLGTGDLAMNLDPAPGESRQRDRSIILVGRVGDAVKVRGMFIHPNQLRFAASQVPGVKQIQAIVTRPENRDELELIVILSDLELDHDALSNAMSKAIQSTCRIKVDQVYIVSEEGLSESDQLIIDKRTWE